MTLTQEADTIESPKAALKSINPASDEQSVEISENAEMEVRLGWRTWVVVFISAYLT